MPKDKLKAYVLLREELLDEKKQLEERLNEINLVLEGTSPLPLRKRRRPAGKTTAQAGRKGDGKITTTDAILKALEEDGAKDVKTIAAAVEQLKGKVSKPSISLGLAKLKKEGRITNPARGQYALKR